MGHKKSNIKGKTRSLLRKGEFDIISKSGQIFRQIKVNFWTVQVKIGTVQDNDSTKSGIILGQYMINKLNCGYVQIEIGTIQDDFWTVQVKIGKVRDADSTETGEILGQYMVIFSTK